MIIRKMILALMLFTFLGLGTWAVFSDKEKVVYVDTAQVSVQTLYTTLSVNGTIMDTGAAAVTMPKAGRISKLFVEEGSSVVKGQVLADVVEVTGTFNIQWPVMPDELRKTISVLGMDEQDFNSVMTQYAYSVFGGIDGQHFYLTSPCDGIVTDLRISPDDYAAAGFKAAAVSDFSALEVSAYVSERNISNLVEGLKVELTGEAFEGTYSGVLTKIMPTAIQTGTLTSAGETVVEIRINVKNPNASLKPGYSAKALIYTVKKTNARLVPYEAVVQNDSGEETVYVLEGNAASARVVETGRELSDYTEILRGISVSDTVILNPVPSQLNGSTVVANRYEDK